jgi:hypothetical protein
MLWRNICLLLLGFYPVAVIGNLYKNKKGTATCRKGGIIHKTIKKQNTQNRKQTYFRFSVPCIFYRLQINVPTDATNYYLYFLCFLSPYMFRAFTGPLSGVSWAAVLLPFGSCRVCWLSVRPWRWLCRTARPPPRTHGQPTNTTRTKW